MDVQPPAEIWEGMAAATGVARVQVERAAILPAAITVARAVAVALKGRTQALPGRQVKSTPREELVVEVEWLARAVETEIMERRVRMVHTVFRRQMGGQLSACISRDKAMQVWMARMETVVEEEAVEAGKGAFFVMMEQATVAVEAAVADAGAPLAAEAWGAEEISAFL